MMDIKIIKLDFPNEGSWDKPELAKFQRFVAIEKELDKLIQEFLQKIDLKSEATIEHNIDDKQLFLERLEFPKGKGENYVKNTQLSILSASIQEIFNNLIVFQQTIYNKYDLSDIYLVNHSEIYQKTENSLINVCKSKYNNISYQITDVLEKSLKTTLKELETGLKSNLELIKTSTVSTHMQIYHSCLELYTKSFENAVAEKLKDLPCDFFISYYRTKLQEAIKESIIVNRLIKNHFQNQDLFQEEVYNVLYKMFWQHFVEGEKLDLFGLNTFRNKENIVTLFGLVLLTDYQRPSGIADTETYLPILEKFYAMFIEGYAEEFQELRLCLMLIKTENKDEMTINQIRHNLNYYKLKWNQDMTHLENLSAMFSLFLAFNFASEEKFHKSYDCLIRYMLKCLFSNLKSGEIQFTNFQVLCCLESLVTEFIRNIDDSERSMTTSSSLLIRNTLGKIRRTLVNSITEHLLHTDQLDELAKKFTIGLLRPEKFFFEKISDHKTSSKSVIICVSGFISEDYRKLGEWEAVCKAFPYSEIIGLNWKSNALSSIASSCWDSIKKQWRDEGIIQGICKSTIATYKTITGSWDITYKQAALTGVYLAHLLADTGLFKGHVVSLMGFSLGTLVVMSCVWELERMDRYDLIYDVLVMGGVVHIGDFQKSSLKSVGHKVINCYCQTDYILQYVLNAADKRIEPIGSGPILYHDKKVTNVDVTRISDGHIKYRFVLDEILIRTDFNEDLSSFYKEN